MDCATDRTTEYTVMMCSSQVGKSEFLLNVMGYYADQEPAPQLMLQPTVEAAESFSKERIDPTFRYSPGLKGKLEEGKDGRGTSRKSSTTIRLKHYPGGYLAMVGSNSPAGLRSRPIRVLLGDELDAMGFTKEGDPLKLAIQRTTNFHNRKICFVSTPTLSGLSKIEDWFLRSDQRHFHIPCPHCGTEQTWKWAQVKWDKGPEGDHLPETARYECAHCSETIRGAGKPDPDLLLAGRWIAHAPGNKGIAGFHINSLYSPWVALEDLVKEWLEVTKSRDKKGLMEFINLKLGEPWVEEQNEITYDMLHRRREYYDAQVPDPVLLLTAGVDVQDSYLAAEIVGWGHGRESWGIEYAIFPGDPGQDQVWQQLDQFLLRTRRFADGNGLSVAAACVDSGGHFTTEVYQFAKARETRRVFAIRGRGGPGLPFIGKPNRNNRLSVLLFNLGVDSGKATLMSRVMIESEGPSYCHWSRRSEHGYDEEYFRGLLSEKLKFEYRNGQTVAKWVKIYERNEPLDCRNYATAAMEILNPDFDWLASQDRRGNVYQQAPSRRRRRRVLSKGVNK